MAPSRTAVKVSFPDQLGLGTELLPNLLQIVRSSTFFTIATVSWSTNRRIYPPMPLAEDRLEILQVRKLIQCVRTADQAQISKLVDLGIAGLVNYQDPSSGESPLHVAVSLNNEAVVLQLLELGASQASHDLEGKTPVMKGCEYGHLQALESLATRGMDVTAMDKAGRPAFFHCLHPTNRHAKCLGFLLECGADPNTRDSSNTPIICAVCTIGLERHLERILEKGADPNAREPMEGKTALVLACEGGHVECVKLLLMHQNTDKNATYGEGGLCALHRAAFLGHFLVIQALSAYGADFTLSSSHQENAIHFAAQNNHLLCIRLLGQRGCPANEENDQGVTPQKLAKQEGFKDAMKELKKLSAFQEKMSRGATPKGAADPWAIQLYDWVQSNKRLLLDLLREQDETGGGVIPAEAFTSTLETMGLPLQSDDIAQLLSIYDKKGEGIINYNDFISEQKYIHAQYKIGPNDDIKGKKGKGKKGGKKGKGKKGGKTKILFPIYYEEARPPTAGVPESVIEKEQYLTDVQRFSGDAELPHTYVDDSAWYLIQPERQYIQLYEAIRHGDLQSVQTALSSGMPVDMRDKYNKTPLMIACAHGRPDVAQFLLDRGADVNAIDNFMWTPLHHSAHSGQERLVKLLLDAGANIDAQSCNGGTPLMRAIETSQKTIIKLLLERGANVNIENKHGASALEVAKNWGDDFIYAIVYAKAQTLPPVVSKKGEKEKSGKGKGKAAGGKGGGKGKKKKGDKEESLPKILPGPPLLPPPPPPQLPSPAEYMEMARRNTTLGSMHMTTLVKPSPAYRPRPAWVSRPPSIQTRLEKAKEEGGMEDLDFGETKTPFLQQIQARVQALEISDA